MLESLTGRLSQVVKTLRGEARLTESNVQDALREVRMALLEADVALPVVRDFIAQVRERALGQEVMGSLTPGQALVGVVHRELVALMGGSDAALDLATTPPAVILMAGLQGSGKTTTSGKLAKMLREQMKKKVLLASADVYRPAAIEQLKTLAGQVATTGTSKTGKPAEPLRRDGGLNFGNVNAKREERAAAVETEAIAQATAPDTAVQDTVMQDTVMQDTAVQDTESGDTASE